MKEINKILIANRGEIAVRIIRAARDLGLSSLAVYADPDGPDALHCRLADRSLSLQGEDLGETYLNVEKLIQLALEHGADALHPGYGFLSENHFFAAACEEAGLEFIGPSSEVIRKMGNKVNAREWVGKLGIPVTEARVSPVEVLLQSAEELEFPLLIKAAEGGGGKGMRIVGRREDLAGALEVSTREASRYFGNGEVFLEKYLDPARHIEFQVLSDRHGNLVHLNERECSVQRRYQKIIEESPSVWLHPATRHKMDEAALKITRELGYTGAGTVEFLVDAEQNFYFLEMNTRIQVEHPVTERVSGIDLVREQIRIAQGLPLPFKQQDISARGHAIEARIYAEDPLKDFLPSPGQVALYREPGNPAIRIDSSLDGPARILSRYDPLILKMISWGRDRTEAIHHLQGGLEETSLLGIETNLPFLQEIMRDEDFIKNRLSVQYCDRKQAVLVDRIKKRLSGIDRDFYIAGFLAASLLGHEPDPPDQVPDGVHRIGGEQAWHATGYWRQCSPFRFLMNGLPLQVELETFQSGTLTARLEDRTMAISSVQADHGEIRFLLNGDARRVRYARLASGEEVVDKGGVKVVFGRRDSLPGEPAGLSLSEMRGQDESVVVSPMHGRIVKIKVKEKEVVEKGDVLLIIDSMKIENNILAPRNARVSRIIVRPGEQVQADWPLLSID